MKIQIKALKLNLHLTDICGLYNSRQPTFFGFYKVPVEPKRHFVNIKKMIWKASVETISAIRMKLNFVNFWSLQLILIDKKQLKLFLAISSSHHRIWINILNGFRSEYMVILKFPILLPKNITWFSKKGPLKMDHFKGITWEVKLLICD